MATKFYAVLSRAQISSLGYRAIMIRLSSRGARAQFQAYKLRRIEIISDKFICILLLLWIVSQKFKLSSYLILSL